MGNAQMRGFSRRIGNPGGRPGVPRAPPESCGPPCPPAAPRPPAVSLPPASPASHSARAAAETGCCFLPRRLPSGEAEPGPARRRAPWGQLGAATRGAPRKSSSRIQTDVNRRRPHAGRRVAASEPLRHPRRRPSGRQVRVTHTADPATSSQRLPERTPCRTLWGYDDKNRFCRTRGVGGARAASSDRIRETSSAERRLVPLRGQGAGAQGGGAPWAGQTGALAPKAIVRSLTHLFSRSVSHRVVEIFRN